MSETPETPETPKFSLELVKQFNEAANLARAGKHEEALVAWDQLLDRSDEVGEGVEANDFLGQTRMHKAWVLMDLERYEEALAIFQSDELMACLGQFDDDTLFWYFFSFGNTFGSMGRIPEMNDELTRALGLAGRELDDVERVQMAWQNMMLFGEEHQAWEYLEEESANCMGFAEQNELQVLGFVAGLHRVTALRGLERLDDARELAAQLLAQAKEWGADDAVTRIEELLAELNA